MNEFITEEGTLMLTGMFITLLSGIFYTTSAAGFRSGGKYRTKQAAVAIYLVSMVALGLLTPLVNELSKVIVKVVPLLSILGFFIVSANFIIHQSIEHWRQTSAKSLLIYSAGVLLIVGGFFVTDTVFV